MQKILYLIHPPHSFVDLPLFRRKLRNQTLFQYSTEIFRCLWKDQLLPGQNRVGVHDAGSGHRVPEGGPWNRNSGCRYLPGYRRISPCRPPGLHGPGPDPAERILPLPWLLSVMPAETDAAVSASVSCCVRVPSCCVPADCARIWAESRIFVHTALLFWRCGCLSRSARLLSQAPLLIH